MHVEAVGAWLVRAPGVAIETGVEMDMAFDEAGNDEDVAGSMVSFAAGGSSTDVIAAMRPSATAM